MAKYISKCEMIMSKEFNQRLKQRMVMLLIALPIGIFFGKFVPDRISNWIYIGFVAVCIVFALYYIIQLGLINRRLDESRVHAEQWKRRIRSVADTTESPDNDLTFDEFCEFEDDKILERFNKNCSRRKQTNPARLGR
jgi:hypothetical protein